MARAIPTIRILVSVLIAALVVSALLLQYRLLVFGGELLAAVLVVLWAGLPIGAVARLAVAPFSRRVRASMASHKIVHIVWFMAALFIGYRLVASFSPPIVRM